MNLTNIINAGHYSNQSEVVANARSGLQVGEAKLREIKLELTFAFTIWFPAQVKWNLITITKQRDS